MNFSSSENDRGGNILKAGEVNSAQQCVIPFVRKTHNRRLVTLYKQVNASGR